jgi:hypothetical protein
MNKAFIREPDDTAAVRCPRCDSPGSAVQAETLDAFLRPEARGALSDAAFFCPFARCEVAYFDQFERVATVESLVRPVYPKDPEAPLCGCFGLGREEIEADIREGQPTRVRALVARAKSPEARCRTANPTGESCIGEVQRYYMRLWQAGGG